MAGGAKKVMVVGDSISDEIKIGNQLGFITVRLKKGIFASNIPKDKSERATFEIADMSELKNILSKYEK